jgi:anti-sigma factor RsiW
MNVSQTTIRRTIATAELLLISPAVLFMTSLFVRNVTPQEIEPAHTAQQIVLWYAARPRLGLWVLLIALPTAVFLTGCAAVLRSWSDDADLRQAARHVLAAIRAHLATVLVALATVTAAGVLAIVAVHVLTD